jgi:phosphopantetheinyl transferase
MPLYKTIAIDTSSKIYIWQITERISALKKGLRLNISADQKLKKIKFKKHKKQFLAMQQLLKFLGLNSYYLSYDTNGKPFLSNGQHIAISHSGNYAVLAISNKNIGIDIEKKQTKLKRIASKFIGTEVDFITKKDELTFLTKIWTAKEALYKLKNRKGLSFKKQIQIQAFEVNASQTNALLKANNTTKTYQIYYYSLEKYILAFAI